MTIRKNVNIILDGCSTLEEWFAKIESNMVVEKLKIEQQQISPVMKRIIQRVDLPERLTSLLAASNIDTNRYLRP